MKWLLVLALCLVALVLVLIPTNRPHGRPLPEIGGPPPEALAVGPPPLPDGEHDAGAAEPPVGDPTEPWTLNVRVRDDSGEPIRCVLIFRGGAKPVRVRTDEKGVAVLAPTGDGELLVRCGSSFVPVLLQGITRPPSGLREIDVELDESLEITGTVIAQDGSTPVKASVRASLVDGPEWLEDFCPSGQAGEDGRFSIRGLPAGRYRLKADPDEDLSGARPDPAPVVEAGASDVRIVLDPQALLTVKVVAEAGGPERPMTTFRVLDAAGKRISSCMYQGERPQGMTVKVRPGSRYRIEVSVPGYRQIGDGEVLLGVNDLRGEIIIPIVPAPEEERARLTLNIRDERGNPIRCILIQHQVNPSVISGSLHTLEDGRVEMPLPPGPSKLFLDRSYKAKPFQDPYLRLTIEVDLAPGEKAVRDVLVPCGGWMRVTLPESTREQPRGKPTVHLNRVGEEPRSCKLVPVETGGFIPSSPKVLRPGTYRLTVEYPGMDTIEKEVVIRPCEVTDVLIP